jgi:hypothetical protein
MKACIAHSTDIDSADAVAELVDGMRAQIGGLTPRVALLFAGIDHDLPLVLRAIQDAMPTVELVGCTTDGELSSLSGFQEDSLVLLVLAGDDVRAVAGLAREVTPDPERRIGAAVREATARLGAPPAFCVTVPVSMRASGSVIVDSFRAALGPSAPVFGGTAGDQWRFKGSHQFYGTEVLDDAVPFLVFAEGFPFSFGVETGWCPMGREGRVTEADGNVLKSVDGERATDFYGHYIGKSDVDGSVEFPLAVYEEGMDRFYLRASPHADVSKGWMTFFGDVPVGARVRVTTASREEVIEATRTALQKALDGLGGRPAVAMCFSCAGRKQLLGSRTSEESRVLRETLGDIPAIGFYGYGEIAPLEARGPSFFHNETFVVLLLGGG